MRSILLCLALFAAPIAANAQAIFSYVLCYANPPTYEQNYVYFHNTYHSLPPFPVCGYTAAQMITLNAQLRAKYGF